MMSSGGVHNTEFTIASFAPSWRMANLWLVRTWRAWLVFGAFALHNLEEALAAPGWFDRMAGRLPVPWLSPGAFQLATAVVTVAGLALTVVAVRFSRPGLVTLPAIVMLVNVIVPHVPLAIWSGGYRDAGQCSALQGGGEGPRWEGRQGPSSALSRAVLLLDVLLH